ncbi:MAG TPA: VOC family protein [Bryobacteraceae bacterium]|jgi:catechol 2,3-dioxygenase-like lactoylglutathione lyase family enzyme|nr:VOC family protein [Bryobacteraceae bacterium]
MTFQCWIPALLCATVAWAQPSSQVGIAHVAFRVSDLEAARAFYAKLGFEQFFEMKQGEKTTEAFLKIDDSQFIELYPQSNPSQRLELMHVCYESNDLAALHADFVKRGLAVSDVRKAGAGNLLMTMKDPEGQTIEYTQYMAGSRHYEDRGKHLGANRVSQSLVGATITAKDVAAMTKFYVAKLGFTQLAPGDSVRLRMPGDSHQEIDIAGQDLKSGIQFSVSDLNRTAAMLAKLELPVSSGDSSVTVPGPDGVAIEFVKR